MLQSYLRRVNLCCSQALEERQWAEIDNPEVWVGECCWLSCPDRVAEETVEATLWWSPPSWVNGLA